MAGIEEFLKEEQDKATPVPQPEVKSASGGIEGFLKEEQQEPEQESAAFPAPGYIPIYHTRQQMEEIKKRLPEYEKQAYSGDTFKEQALHSRWVKPGASIVEPVYEPFVKGFQRGKEQGKGFVGTLTEAAKGFIEDIKGESETAPVTTEELESLYEPVIGAKDMFKTTPQKLSRTYLPKQEVFKEGAKNLLEMYGKNLNSQTLEQLLRIAKTRGTMLIQDPTTVQKATEALDALTLNLGSAKAFEKALNESELLKRPENFVALTPKQRKDAEELIQKAKQGDTDTALYLEGVGKIEIKPTSDIKSVEDAVYAASMTSQIARLTDLAVSGKVQDIGQLIMAAVPEVGIAKAGAALTKIPTIAKIASKTPGIVKGAAASTLNVGTQAGLTYAGTVGGDEDKENAALAAAVLTGGIETVAKTVRASSKVVHKWQDKMKNKITVGHDDATLALVKNSSNFETAPEEIRATMSKPEFIRTKILIDGAEELSKQIQTDAKQIEVKGNYDPKTQQGFKMLWDDKQLPEAQRLRDNLSMLKVITERTSLEEARVKRAMIEAVAGISPGEEVKLVEPYQISILNRYQDAWGDARSLIKRVDKDFPEIAAKFKEILDSDTMKPQEFYWRESKDLLNKPMDMNINNLQAVSEAFDHKQKYIKELKARQDQLNIGEIQSNLKSLKSESELANLNFEKAQSYVSQRLRYAAELAEKPETKARIMDVVNDVETGRVLTNSSLQMTADILDNVAGIRNEFLSGVKIYKKELKNVTKAQKNYADYLQASVYNMNPDEHIPNRIKFMETEADRVAFNLLENKLDLEDNINFIKRSYFKNQDLPPEIDAQIRSVVFDRMPKRLAAIDEIVELHSLLDNPDLPESYKKGIRKFDNVLQSYNRDVRLFNRALDSLADKNTTLPSALSKATNALDQIRNPRLAAELQVKVDNSYGKFVDFFRERGWEDANTLKLWDYITGDPYVKLKIGMTDFPVIDDYIIDSMIKAQNALGRDVIDTYAGVYQIAYNQPLDKNIFHAFFCTPSNRFDESGTVFTGALRVAMKDRSEILQKYASTNKIARTLVAIKSLDAMEIDAARVSEISAGPMYSILVNDWRKAKQLAYEFNEKFVDPRLVRLNCYKDKAFSQDTVFVKMVKKANILKGYRPGYQIDNFVADGSWSLTKYGQFLDYIFHDEKLLAAIKKLKGLDPDTSAKLKSQIADLVESQGFVDPGTKSPFGKRLSEEWVEYTFSYWNFFDSENPGKSFDYMKEWRQFYAYVDAEKLKFSNSLIEAGNANAAAYNGAKLQPIKFRNNRVRNRKVGDNTMVTHTYQIAFEDLRKTHLLGTDEDAIAKYSNEYDDTNTMNPLQLLGADVWSSIYGAQTGHARSMFQAYAIGLNHFGFNVHANWMYDRAALVPNSSLVVENMAVENWLRWVRSSGKKDFISYPIVLGGETALSLIDPFIKLSSPLNIMKNNSQAAAFGIGGSINTLRKVVGLPTAMLRVFVMTPFYNKEGIPYQWYRQTLKHPEIVNVIDDVVRKYSDSQFRAYEAAKQQYAISGKYPEGYETVLLKTRDAIRRAINENLKERSELYHVRVSAEQGANIAQSIIKLINEGNEQKAYNILSKVFRTQSSASIAWHLENFKRNLANNQGLEAIRAFLPSYIDQNTGRFGRIVQPQFVNTVSKYVPGVGLFYAAKNLQGWQIGQNLHDLFRKHGKDKMRAGLALFHVTTAAAATSAYFYTITNGLPGSPVKDLILNNEENKKLFLTKEEDIDNWGDYIRRMLVKGGVEGIAPGLWDMSTWGGMDFTLMAKAISDGKIDVAAGEAITKTFMDLLGFGGGRGSNVNIKIPLYGYYWERGQHMIDFLSAAWRLHVSFPEDKLKDPNELYRYNEWLASQDNDLMRRWNENPNDENLVRELALKSKYYREMFWPIFLNEYSKISPVGILSANPVVWYYAWKEMTISKVADEEGKIKEIETYSPNLISQEGKEVLTIKGKFGEDYATPFTSVSDAGALPLRRLTNVLYKEMFDVQPENLEEFMDGIFNIFIKNGLISPDYAARILENNKRELEIMFGQGVLQDNEAEQTIPLDDTLLDMDYKQSFQKGLQKGFPKKID